MYAIGRRLHCGAGVCKTSLGIPQQSITSLRSSLPKIETSTTSHLMAIVAEIRNNPSHYDGLIEKLRENTPLYRGSAAHLITCANAVSNQVKRSFLERSDQTDRFICECLEGAFREPSGLYGVFIARGLRAASVLGSNEKSGRVISMLVREASQSIRVPHYSAMDLSELIHSGFQIIVAWEKDEQLTGFEDVVGSIILMINDLAREFLARKSSIQIRLHKRSRRETEVVSIQALSNVVFVLYHLRNTHGGEWIEIYREGAEAIFSLLGEQTEEEAFRSCQVHHLMTFLESALLSNCQRSASWARVVRKLVRELDRRFDQIDKSKTDLFTLLEQMKDVVQEKKTLAMLDSIQYRLAN